MKILIICCLLFIHVNMCIFIRGFRVSIRVSGIRGFGFGDGFPPESVSGSGFDFVFWFWVHGDSTRSEPDPLPSLLVNSTMPVIAFAVNLLARHSAAPTKRHWVGGKQILRYLNGTKDLSLFYEKNQDPTLVGYTDAGYLSDPHNARSQTGFVFSHGGTAISWKSSKQTLVATSTNHSEIIALYEASRECVWLRRMVNYIQRSCCIGSLESPTIIYEDNIACVIQMQTGYI